MIRGGCWNTFRLERIVFRCGRKGCILLSCIPNGSRTRRWTTSTTIRLFQASLKSLRIIYSAQRGTTLIIARVLLILVTLSRDCNRRASEQNMPSGEHERVGRDHRSVSEVRLVFEGSRTTSPDQRGSGDAGGFDLESVRSLVSEFPKYFKAWNYANFPWTRKATFKYPF